MPDEWAQLLEDAGYDDLDSVINASVEDLTAIEGVDDELAGQMIELGRKHEQVDEGGGESSDEDEESEDEDADDSDADADADAESAADDAGDEEEDEDTGEEASDEQKAEASVE
jgi:hypothetical protein